MKLSPVSSGEVHLGSGNLRPVGLIHKSIMAQLTSSESGRGHGSPLSATLPQLTLHVLVPPAPRPPPPAEGGGRGNQAGWGAAS